MTDRAGATPPRPLPPEDQERLARAVGLAARWHAGQVRKGTDVPYLSHLLQVAGLVLEHGGGVDLAVAGLLHDALEDTDATVEDVADAFGPEVAAVVADCTDTLPGDRPGAKAPWEERKRRWLARLPGLSPASALVAACDKRHNLAALVADARRGGLAAISPPRFSRPPDRQVWFHREAHAALAPALPPALAEELGRLVDELAALVAAGDDRP